MSAQGRGGPQVNKFEEVTSLGNPFVTSCWVMFVVGSLHNESPCQGGMGPIGGGYIDD